MMISPIMILHSQILTCVFFFIFYKSAIKEINNIYLLVFFYNWSVDGTSLHSVSTSCTMVRSVIFAMIQIIMDFFFHIIKKSIHRNYMHV